VVDIYWEVPADNKRFTWVQVRKNKQKVLRAAWAMLQGEQ